MTLKRVLLFLAAFAVAFILGQWIVPSVFVGTPADPTLPAVDLSYQHPCVIDKSCATDLNTKPDDAVEYTTSSNPQTLPTDNLIWTGRFRSDQFPYKHGESWLGLFREGTKYSILKTKLAILKLKEPGDSDIEVSTDKPGRALFMVRQMPFLREGEVTTVWDDETVERATTPLNREPRTFEFTGKIYTLSVEGAQDGQLIKGSKLVLTSGNDRQVLRSLDKDCSECAWTISWAGDIDLDGKLDLYMELPDEPNVTERVLFLSSQSQGGKLVKHVASFRASL